jgi:DNA repair protein RadC
MRAGARTIEPPERRRRGARSRTADSEPARTLRDLPADERPRERLLQLGAEHLDDHELLAILLRVGVVGETAVDLARSLLKENGGFWGVHNVTLDHLRARRGLADAKIAQIKAAFEIGSRMARRGTDSRPRITRPDDAVRLLRDDMVELEQEEMRVLLLDQKHAVVSDPETVFRGTLNSTPVRMADLFRPAVRANAAAIVVAHNHPSGDPTPSPEDLAVTREIIRGGRTVDIEVLDHLVIGRAGWRSLRRDSDAFRGAEGRDYSTSVREARS